MRDGRESSKPRHQCAWNDASQRTAARAREKSNVPGSVVGDCLSSDSRRQSETALSTALSPFFTVSPFFASAASSRCGMSPAVWFAVAVVADPAGTPTLAAAAAAGGARDFSASF